jgi:FK506-binding protein 2
MRSSFFAIIALLVPFTLALDKPLDIEVTKPVSCDRKSKGGDQINVHYRGTLASDGKHSLPLSRL